MYRFYLDGMLLPVTPEKVKIKIQNQNKTVNLIDGGEINFLKAAGLTEVQFDALLPQVRYPFAVYEGSFCGAEHYLDRLKRFKNGLKPFRFIITRENQGGDGLFDTNLLVSLEDYQIGEDAKDGTDLTVTIKLKQYRSFGTKRVVISPSRAEARQPTPEKQREADAAPNERTHTVQAGDCLWNLAKQYLGDGARYGEIYELNRDKIVNPNLIYPGQVLVLPEVGSK